MCCMHKFVTYQLMHICAKATHMCICRCVCVFVYVCLLKKNATSWHQISALICALVYSNKFILPTHIILYKYTYIHEYFC